MPYAATVVLWEMYSALGKPEIVKEMGNKPKSFSAKSSHCSGYIILAQIFSQPTYNEVYESCHTIHSFLPTVHL